MGQKAKRILVAERDYFPLLLSARESSPFALAKIITPDELLDRLSFRFGEKAIPHMLPLGMDVIEARKWLAILRIADLSKCPKGQSILDALKDDVETDPLGEYEFHDAEVYLFEMDEDIALHGFLGRKGIAHKDAHFGDFGMEPKDQKREVLVFRNRYEQYTHIFASLRKALLEKTLSPEEPLLLLGDEKESFYLKLFGSMFGMPVRMQLSVPLRSKVEVAALVDVLYSHKSLALTEEEKESEGGKLLSPIIEEYGLADLPFDLGYACLQELLLSHKERLGLNDAGLEATTSFSFLPSRKVYITCFQDGVFPHVHTDDNVLNDQECLSCGVNPSYVVSLLDRRKKENYCRYLDVILFSRVKEHLQDKIYDSPFLKDWKWEVKDNARIPIGDGAFTLSALRLRQMKTLDDAFYREPVGDLASYSSVFKGIPEYRYGKDHYSVTKLEAYRRCPYRFYLDSVLPEEPSELSRRAIGTMTHAFLETIYAKDFDMEDALARAKNAFIEAVTKNGATMTGKDTAIMELTMNNLKVYAPFIRDQLNHGDYESFLAEKGVKFSLSDGEHSYVFHGFIDCILWSKDHYVVIDFKTGQERFDPAEIKAGLSTQLPLYYYALKSTGFEPGLSFAGMGIKPVAFPSFKSCFKDDKGCLTWNQGLKSMTAKGRFTDEDAVWQTLDDTVLRKNSKGIGFFLSPKEVKGFVFDPNAEPTDSGDSLANLIRDAVLATIDSIHAIEQGQFPIAPLAKDGKSIKDDDSLPCGYCPYKDVCYHNIARDGVKRSTLVEAFEAIHKKGGE